MTVNFDTGALGYFVNGEKADSTKCSIDYLKQSCIFNNDLSFIAKKVEISTQILIVIVADYTQGYYQMMK